MQLARLIAAVVALLPRHYLERRRTGRPGPMVVPFAAGAASDVVGRMLAARMSQILGQQVIVENTCSCPSPNSSAR
jgi:tripartite-type tricarboxylate transporter receptor subunit TctC